MRCVTMNPPKILTAANVTATKPMNLAKPNSAGPAAIIAPTMMTLDGQVVNPAVLPAPAPEPAEGV